MRAAIHTRYRCFTWRYKSCSLHAGQKSLDARKITHITLIVFLAMPQEVRLGLIVLPLRAPLPVPNTQQTDVKSRHWPWAKFLAVQTAKEFRALVDTCFDFALLLRFGSTRKCLFVFIFDLLGTVLCSLCILLWFCRCFRHIFRNDGG